MDIKQKLKKDHLVWNSKKEMDISRFGALLLSDNMDEFFNEVVPKHKIVFLINGLSSILLNELDDSNLLKQNCIKDLYSVIPTTELNTLISFYKGISPGTHGILGEYQHNKKLNVSYSYTTFLDRIDDRNLSIYGLTPKKLYQFPVLEKTKKKKFYTLFPSSILLNDSWNGILDGQHVISYHNLNEAMKKAARPMKTNFTGTTTIVYITELETMMKHGAKKEALKEWLTTFTEMASALKHKNNAVMITALRGMTEIDASIVLNYVKYNKYFYALPSIEKRMTSFYVREEYETEFVREFKKDYGHLLGLYKTEELIELGIFGEHSHLENYGEYISVNLDHNYLEIPINETLYMEELNNPEYIHAASGGMSEEEVIVPLILL